MAICNQGTYDVFLSFRGEDTRNNFTSHLYSALQNCKINTFIDSDIHRGDNFSSSLLDAIEASKISVVVFSPNFLSSTWCLGELVKILECKRYRGQLVLPVFYHVDPSDIQKQTGIFQLSFAGLEEKFRDDLQKVERWKSALHEVAAMSGWHIGKSENEAEVVQQIVEAISRRLLRRKLSSYEEYRDVFVTILLLLFQNLVDLLPSLVI